VGPAPDRAHIPPFRRLQGCGAAGTLRGRPSAAPRRRPPGRAVRAVPADPLPAAAWPSAAPPGVPGRNERAAAGASAGAPDPRACLRALRTFRYAVAVRSRGSPAPPSTGRVWPFPPSSAAPGSIR